MLLSGTTPEQISIDTPKGVILAIDVLDAGFSEGYAGCAVRKDAGDDPDITDGAMVYAKVKKQKSGITIDGGAGIGRVTKPGLDQPVGAAAINSVPREMIERELRKAAQMYDYRGGFSVIISIPGGEEMAKRTFNPRLGIEGGISIIGTSGIVEPMSHQALEDTIHLELSQRRTAGMREVLFTPGNYGKTFARKNLGLSLHGHVCCSNLIGEAIDHAVELEFKQILLIGHMGKLVKLGIGVTNTHSSCGDGRMETLLACALEAGGNLALLKGILYSATTDAALAQIKSAGLLTETLDLLNKRIHLCLTRRVPSDVTVGYLCFTNTPQPEVLFRSKNADELMRIWRK